MCECVHGFVFVYVYLCVTVFVQFVIVCARARACVCVCVFIRARASARGAFLEGGGCLCVSTCMYLCMRACSFVSVCPVFTDGSVTKDGSWGGLTARIGATSIHGKQ